MLGRYTTGPWVLFDRSCERSASESETVPEGLRTGKFMPRDVSHRAIDLDQLGYQDSNLD